jgi:hypothetical protein
MKEWGASALGQQVAILVLESAVENTRDYYRMQ